MTQMAQMQKGEQGIGSREQMAASNLLPFDPGPEPSAWPAVPWTAEENLVWAEIRFAKGRAQAVPIRALIERAHLPERTIKQAVRDLVMRHGLLIGAVREKAGGYYCIQTAEELEETVGYLRSQAINELRRCWILLGKSNVRLREMLGQMELEIVSEPRASASGQ